MGCYQRGVTGGVTKDVSQGVLPKRCYRGCHRMISKICYSNCYQRGVTGMLPKKCYRMLSKICFRRWYQRGVTESLMLKADWWWYMYLMFCVQLVHMKCAVNTYILYVYTVHMCIIFFVQCVHMKCTVNTYILYVHTVYICIIFCVLYSYTMKYICYTAYKVRTYIYDALCTHTWFTVRTYMMHCAHIHDVLCPHTCWTVRTVQMPAPMYHRIWITAHRVTN